MAQTRYTDSPLPGPAPPAPRPPAPEGFSLLEVLVATAIMGMVLVAEKILQENCEINTLARGTSQGRDGQYDYVVQVTPQYELADPFADKRILCSLIQVTLTWQEWGRRKTLELQTIRTVAQKEM